MKYWSLAIAVGGIAYCVSQGADARSMSVKSAPFPDRQMAIYGVADAPVGYIKFCDENPDECRNQGHNEAEVILTTAKWKELQTINLEVNLAVKPLSDQAQYNTIEKWTYPFSGNGDCEDYVLLKMRRLMERGWPQSVLLITVVRDEHGEGHAVLTVRTGRGDLILDNKNSRIVAWKQTPYQFIKRQSSVDPQRWNSLIPMRDVPTISASGAEPKE
jgi:predicted transglutaminase-like cysteine proteinase